MASSCQKYSDPAPSKIGGRIDVSQPVHMLDAKPIKGAFSIGQCMFRRPTDIAKHRWTVNPRSNEPVAAIFGRSKDRVGRPQRPEGPCDDGLRDPRNISADDADPPRWLIANDPPHAVAKIAGALRDPGQVGRPNPALPRARTRR